MDGKTETHFCPTCGGETTYRSSPEWLMGHFRGKYTGMLSALIVARRMQRGLSLEELAQAAYANILAPVPKKPSASLRVLLVNNHDKLEKLGWRIAGPHQTGNGYWLVPIERD